MIRMKTALIACVSLVLVPVMLSACGPDLEKATFNTWFQQPSGEKVLIGQVEGISRCRELARIKAQDLNIEDNHKWGYVCCLRSNTSECAQEHK